MIEDWGLVVSRLLPWFSGLLICALAFNLHSFHLLLG